MLDYYLGKLVNCYIKLWLVVLVVWKYPLREILVVLVVLLLVLLETGNIRFWKPLFILVMLGLGIFGTVFIFQSSNTSNI